MQEMWEMRVQSLGREDPLEEEMATHSSILVWKISWTEEPGGLQSMGSQRIGRDWSNLEHTHREVEVARTTLATESGTWDKFCNYEQEHPALQTLEIHHVFQHLYFYFL